MSNDEAFKFWEKATYKQEQKQKGSWTHQGFTGKAKILQKRALWYWFNSRN